MTKRRKGKKKHEHSYKSGIISLAFAFAGKGYIAQCDKCYKHFNKNTGETILKSEVF